MATNHARLPQRRILAQRAKVDENAMSRHARQPSSSGTTGPIRIAAKENVLKATSTRQALSEVTIAAVNRRDTGIKPSTGKEKEEIGLKRGRSDSTTLAQRVPLGPGRAALAPAVTNNAETRTTLPSRNRVTAPLKRASTRIAVAEQIQEELAIRVEDLQSEMDVEENILDDVEEALRVNEEEVEAMIGVEDSSSETGDEEVQFEKQPRIWPDISTELAMRYDKEVQSIRSRFDDEVDMYDTTMVSEYAEEIFEYMGDLEEEVMPNPDYMKGQAELSWGMRQTLVDWLLQVHLRYHMVPETLWIAVNIVDRFLTKRVVSLMKLQLVGVTAMFIAAKYEEIIAPSVDEFVFVTEKGYTKDEILKGERIMLQTLEFHISHYCSPYNWMRKISKADDYDIQTRTLSKFLTEVTLLDYRFLRVKPSLVAAVGMYTARRMLGGDWNEAFIYHSGYTEEYLLPGHGFLVSKLTEENFHRQYVCKKYANKKFLKASVFAIEWAKGHANDSDAAIEPMVLAE